MTTREDPRGPLSGIRVIELAAVVAGPTAGLVLADLGAEVIKVEPPGGDAVRHIGPEKDGVSLWWKFLGRNKRSICLDLSTEGGREMLLRLAETADVIIESFRPGTLERWDLTPEILRTRNDRLVIVRITGYGRHGPRASQPAFGTLVEAMSGLASLNGATDGPPGLPPVALADYLTGFATTIAVLAALRARDDGPGTGSGAEPGGGGGQVVEVSLLGSLLTLLNLQIVQYDQTGVLPPRLGNRMATTAPRNIYPTADGRWVAVSGTTRKTAQQLLALAGRPDLADQDWFTTGAGRFAHVDELDQAMRDWTGQLSLAEIVTMVRAAGATAGPVNDVAQLLEDEQVSANDLIVTVCDPDLGATRMPGPLFALDRTPGSVRWLGERLGESTGEVLAGLGVTRDEVASLREAGAIR